MLVMTVVCTFPLPCMRDPGVHIHADVSACFPVLRPVEPKQEKRW